jgi:hypothetical protein
VLPLLQEFVGLENREVARKAYDAVRDMWPSDESTSESDLRNPIAIAEIAPSTVTDQLVNWGHLTDTLELESRSIAPIRALAACKMSTFSSSYLRACPQ